MLVVEQSRVNFAGRIETILFVSNFIFSAYMLVSIWARKPLALLNQRFAL
jgi:hypothetical protein